MDLIAVLHSNPNSQMLNEISKVELFRHSLSTMKVVSLANKPSIRILRVAQPIVQLESRISTVFIISYLRLKCLFSHRSLFNGEKLIKPLPNALVLEWPHLRAACFCSTPQTSQHAI